MPLDIPPAPPSPDMMWQGTQPMHLPVLVAGQYLLFMSFPQSTMVTDSFDFLDSS
jgi:hypothetical protein